MSSSGRDGEWPWWVDLLLFAAIVVLIVVGVPILGPE